MGTTLDHLKDDANVRFNWVLAIEGYENIITDSSDTSAALTSWAATEVTGCLPGLSVGGPFEQELNPWSDEISVSQLSFSVLNETFATTVFGGGGANRTLLTEDLTCSEVGIDVKGTSKFTLGDFIYIGTETIDTGGGGAAVFAACTRGMYSPFNRGPAADYRYGHPHMLHDVEFDVQSSPVVTDEHRVWKGKWVGLWAHRVTGTNTWDTLAQAQLVFSGKISEIRDTASGSVVVICDDARAAIRDHVVLKNQFRAKPREGIYMAAGGRIRFQEKYQTNAGGALTKSAIEDLTIVAAGAGADEMNAGYYTLGELLDEVNAWLQQMQDDGDIDGKHTLSLSTDKGGVTTRLRSEYAAQQHFQRAYLIMPKYVLDFIGWSTGHGSGSIGTWIHTYAQKSFDAEVYSPETPWRYKPYQPQHQLGARTLEFQSSTGDWINERDYLPEPWRTAFTGSGENWGVISVNGKLALAQYVSDTEFYFLPQPILTQQFGGETLQKSEMEGVRYGDDFDVEIRQVVILQGGIATIIQKLLASTGTSGYNSASYDKFSYGLGAAIPYDLISNVGSDIGKLQEQGTWSSMTVMLDKPTPLSTVIMPELFVRNATFVIKEGVLRVVRYQHPDAVKSAWTLTEENKAAPGNGYDAQLTTTEITDRYMRNFCVIKYNRTGADDYRSTVNIKNQASIDDHGLSKRVTIKFPNHWANVGAAGDTALKLIADLAVVKMPVFGAPMRVVRRTISQRQFFAVPGEIVKITDSFVRDPTTGTRGVTSQAAMILRQSHDWGGPGKTQTGEVELLILSRSALKRWAPAGKVTVVGGNSSITGAVIDVDDDEYSDASEDDDWTMFADGDAVVVQQIDPPTPGTALSWNRTVSGTPAGGQITVNASITAEGDWDATQMYRIIPRNYTNCASSQQSAAFQAGTDDLVESTAEAGEYVGIIPAVDATAPAATNLPEKHSGEHSDGDPITPSSIHAIAKMANNLISYKTAAQSPNLRGSAWQCNANELWKPVEYKPFYVGLGSMEAQSRLLSIAPIIWRSVGAGVAKCRVTVCRHLPHNEAEQTLNDPIYTEPYKQVTFTTTAAAAEIPTAETVDINGLYSINEGIVWICVDLYGDATTLPSYWGLAELWLGPLVADSNAGGL
jgi:hypothetical protein